MGRRRRVGGGGRRARAPLIKKSVRPIPLLKALGTYFISKKKTICPPFRSRCNWTLSSTYHSSLSQVANLRSVQLQIGNANSRFSPPPTTQRSFLTLLCPAWGLWYFGAVSGLRFEINIAINTFRIKLQCCSIRPVLWSNHTVLKQKKQHSDTKTWSSVAVPKLRSE